MSRSERGKNGNTASLSAFFIMGSLKKIFARKRLSQRGRETGLRASERRGFLWNQNGVHPLSGRFCAADAEIAVERNQKAHILRGGCFQRNFRRRFSRSSDYAEIKGPAVRLSCVVTKRENQIVGTPDMAGRASVNFSCTGLPDFSVFSPIVCF